MSRSETKICQNCKKDFTIESEDFNFYKKIDVPPPTFCPECRFQRRLMFKNERVLYKRPSDFTGKDIITIFSPDKLYKVYENKIWWGDNWDQYEYGMDYDSNRSFFDQFKELQQKTPWMNLIVDPNNVNSDYVNHTGSCKNSFLIFNSDFCENVLYSVMAVSVKDSMDCIMIGESELCYENIDGGGFQVFFSENSNQCVNTYFLKDCLGCNDCFGCVNLRKKKYHIFNKPYLKDEYKKKIDSFNLHSFSNLEKIKKEVYNFWTKFPRKYMYGLRNVNVTGDYTFFSKNSKNMYKARYTEDSKYCQEITIKSMKDCYDITEWGKHLELSYDSLTTGDNSQKVKFCFGSWSGAQNTEYCMITPGCSNCFGCCNIKKAEYCILNKKYTEKEYFKLRDQIIGDMNKKPYLDKKGRIWKYGEFFPYDLSLFSYNESQAIQQHPMSKEEVLEKGWSWREMEPSPHKITMTTDQIPDSIHNINDSILDEILECSECKKPFKIVKHEFDLLKRFVFPIPRKCPDCRHMNRIGRLNPPKLWNRQCMKENCGNKFQTSYSLDRPEIVYCEKCYQNEVA